MRCYSLTSEVIAVVKYHKLLETLIRQSAGIYIKKFSILNSTFNNIYSSETIRDTFFL